MSDQSVKPCAGAALCAMALIAASGCSAEVAGMVEEAQANRMVSALAEGGVEASKSRSGGKKGGFKVTVPSSQLRDAMTVLKENGLPRSEPRGFSDTFGKGGLMASPIEERARMMQAVTGELERTLESLDGVVLARVHVVLPDRSGMERGAQAATSSAAVVLKVRRGGAPDGNSIRRMVSKSVEGLEEKNVAIEIFESNSALRRQGAVSEGEPGLAAKFLIAAMASILCGAGVLGVSTAVRRKSREVEGAEEAS